VSHQTATVDSRPRISDSSGSQQVSAADGADVVFTDTPS